MAGCYGFKLINYSFVVAGERPQDHQYFFKLFTFTDLCHHLPCQNQRNNNIAKRLAVRWSKRTPDCLNNVNCALLRVSKQHTVYIWYIDTFRKTARVRNK